MLPVDKLVLLIQQRQHVEMLDYLRLLGKTQRLADEFEFELFDPFSLLPAVDAAIETNEIRFVEPLCCVLQKPDLRPHVLLLAAAHQQWQLVDDLIQSGVKFRFADLGSLQETIRQQLLSHYQTHGGNTASLSEQISKVFYDFYHLMVDIPLPLFIDSLKTIRPLIYQWRVLWETLFKMRNRVMDRWHLGTQIQDLLRFLIALQEEDISYQDVVNQMIFRDASALWIAVSMQELTLVKLLLQITNINLNLVNANGETVLHLIAKKNIHKETAELILAQPNIDPIQTNAQGKTPAIIAAEKQNAEALELFNKPRLQNDAELLNYLFQQDHFKKPMKYWQNTVILCGALSNIDTLTAVKKLAELISAIDSPSFFKSNPQKIIEELQRNHAAFFDALQMIIKSHAAPLVYIRLLRDKLVMQLDDNDGVREDLFFAL